MLRLDWYIDLEKKWHQLSWQMYLLRGRACLFGLCESIQYIITNQPFYENETRYIITFSSDWFPPKKLVMLIDDNLINLHIFYQEIDQAAKAMEELQGSTLPSSDRGGMHIEYPPILFVHRDFILLCLYLISFWLFLPLFLSLLLSRYARAKMRKR